MEAGYRGAAPPPARGEFREEPEADMAAERRWWKQPLGAGLRGTL